MSTHIPANEKPVDITPVRRALISVSDKTGIVEFAQALHAAGVEILSTGGTYKLLIDNQTKASIVLGLNRGTLRKKLKQYGML